MIETVRARARSYFDDAPPAHDWHHVRRVETIAGTLLDRHPEPADERIVALAASLHDVGRGREDRGEIDDHARWGAEEAGRILADVGASDETIARVHHCVRTHRYSTGPDPETVEAKLVADADDLDALGAVGLARVFAHGGAVGSPIHDPAAATEDAPPTAETSYEHVHEKILALPERMYTDTARELAVGRARFVREYVEQFDREVAGER